MPLKRIILWTMPDELMFVIEHPSGVLYENQVGGVVCFNGEQEGVLAPLDVARATVEAVQNLPYPQGVEGISEEIADALDALLTAESRASMIKVDRERLHESWEAWIYVRIEAPRTIVRNIHDDYHGSVYGFGPSRGVLTWQNSD
jgi:Family of unknown function (DUF6210)